MNSYGAFDHQTWRHLNALARVYVTIRQNITDLGRMIIENCQLTNAK